MTLTIHGAMPHASGSVEISETAAKRARLSFNPSGNPRVDRIKTLTAALYSELEQVIEDAGGEGSRGTAQREAATAATYLQAGAMFAVSAATADK